MKVAQAQAENDALSADEGDNGVSIPYFLWDRRVSEVELRAALHDPQHPEHLSLFRVLLREARPAEVWSYVTPQQVVAEWALLAPGLGRRRAFWQWLLDAWRAHGYLR